MTKQEKIQLLKNLQAGKKTISDILPMTFKDFYSIDGVITDDSGKTFTEAEINARYSIPLNNTFVTILTYNNEEEKNLFTNNQK